MGYVDLAPLRDNIGRSFIDKMVDEVARDCVLYLPLYKLPEDSFRSRDANAHLCSVTGALWTPNGRYFDGINDRVSVANHPSLNLPVFTVEFWWKGETPAENYAGPINNRVGGQKGFQVLSDSPGTSSYIPHLLIWDGSSETYNYTSPAGTLSYPFAFKHMTWTWNGSTPQFIMNGIGYSVGAGVSGFGGIGIFIGFGYHYAGGVIGEVRVYNQVLTLAEIRRIYLATKWRYGL